MEDVLTVLAYILTPTIIITFLLCCITIHGGGEMGAYITLVERWGDRIIVTAKDGEESSKIYKGCITLDDEQRFKDVIGRKVRLKWDESFSFSLPWTECPAPVRLPGKERLIMGGKE